MRHPPRRNMQTPCSAEVFPRSPGSEAFARQRPPMGAPAPEAGTGLVTLAGGQLGLTIRDVSAPPDNHVIVHTAA
jgi:hypothetical protein